MRADRLLSLVLLLQARGSVTGRDLAAELEVSVRTVYRDLGALAAAGVPVITESGPGGGCRLMAGYRFPLRGLRPEEAEALLILGVPAALRELGLDRALDAAHRQIRLTAGSGAAAQPGLAVPGAALVHLDLPRWFGGREEVPWLRDLARAVRSGRQLAFGYRHRDGREDEVRAAPLGLVNKAGAWYLVAAPLGLRNEAGTSNLAATPQAMADEARIYRAGRIAPVRVRPETFARPAGFELAAFWREWSAGFEASRPRIPVTLRAAPGALTAFGEVFGQAAGPALAAALPPDEHGWRVVTLSFEHELAAAYRLAGFGDQVEVLAPAAVRQRLLITARQILRRYDAAD
ncbi:MAG: helix-turn-helix transcriptional regulator [Streptosporangiaceae bacterium]